VIKEKNLGTKVAIIYDKSNDYSAGIEEEFLKKAEEIGLEVVTTQAFTNQSNTDFSVQLQAVKNSGADLLFLPIYAQEAAYILTQAEKLGVDVAVMGSDGLDGIIEKAGSGNVSAIEDVLVVTPFYADEDTTFVKAYKAAYGTTPDQFAADGYDAVYAIKAAMEQSGAVPTDSDFNTKMIAAMTQIKLDGVTGAMTWTKEGEPTKEATVVQIKSGSYVPYA
jgi:branched-chain amino acid transport system substrate-binding protein